MLRHRVALATACLLACAGPEGALAQTPVTPPSPPPAAPPASAPEAVKPPPAPVARHVRPRRHGQAAAHAAPAALAGDTIQAIRVVGNERIEEGTILSYMLVQPGDLFAGDRVDKSLRTLYATGLFADVNLQREGNTLVVHVVENPLVNRITFEGNHNVKEEDLRKELELKPRAVFSVRQAQADRQHLLNVYAGKGRFAATVTPELVRLPQNRVNVVFKIVEGPKTLISRIVFVGNHAFGEDRLRDVVDSREERWWRFLSSSDEFNPGRVDFDRELIRRFYLAHGYADVQVTNATSELSPDRKEFFLTFQISEGERYKIGNVGIKSTVPHLDGERYRGLLDFSRGRYYNGDKVEKVASRLEDQIRRDNFVFIRVDPKIRRNPKTHTVDLQFDIEPGPRVYVERIDISGNSVTRDKVIRREFRYAEGDPLDPTLTRISKTRLQDLGYFSDVKVTPEPGSAPDRTIIDTQIVEKATGELSLGGGYSTLSGVLGQAGLRQHNLIGSGIDAGINGTLGYYESQVDLSATDPYFLDRNLVAGGDIFYLNNNNQYITDYTEQRYGVALRLGYGFNDHVSQAWNYTVTDRNVGIINDYGYNLQSYASQYVLDEIGWSLLSQIGQTMTFDWRDSRAAPTSGFVLRVGTDFAGLGGDERYVRAKVDGTYFIPLEYFTDDPNWNIALSAGGGHLFFMSGQERIVDRFFLGGDNLRGFLDQGVGPHSVAYSVCAAPVNGNIHDCGSGGLIYHGSDSLGGKTIWTSSAELHFPLPVSQDFGLSGRTFVDAGGLFDVKSPENALISCLPTSRHVNGHAVDQYGDPITSCLYDDETPRVSAGFGISWKSPFGLINIDIGYPLIKKPYDQLEIFRFGFGTRFQ